MATRFYLPSTGAAAVSPTISAADWAHINTVRRPLNAVNGGSAIATIVYQPDAADHLVAGRAHFVQFVSDVLPPQTIAAQLVKLQVRAAEDHANNNLFVNWAIRACSEDGSSLLGTLLSVKADATEPTTALTNRGDTATTTAFSTIQNFRLVLEIGLGGTPVVTTGTQGHNGSLSFGESAATDLPEDDAATGALNPWVQFAQNLQFGAVVKPQGWARVEVAIAKGDPTQPAGWVVTPTLLMFMFPFEARYRIGRLFELVSRIDFDHDDIMVLMVDVNLSAPLTDRVRELRDRMLPMQKVCLLDNGLRLADLTPAQIAARVG